MLLLPLKWWREDYFNFQHDADAAAAAAAATATHWYTAATLSLGGFQVWRLPPYHGFLKEFKNHFNFHAQFYDSLFSFMGLSSSAFHIFGPLFAYFWPTLFASFAFIRSTLQYGKISTLCIWMPSAFILMAVSHHILSSRKRAVGYTTIHFSDTSRCS